MSSNHYGRYPFGQRPAPGTGRTADPRTQGAQGQNKPQDERPSYAQPGQPGYRPQQPGRPGEQTQQQAQQQAQREQAQQHAQQQVQREQAEREQAAREAAQEQAAEQESQAQQDEPLDFDVLDEQSDATAEVLELQAQLAEAKDMLLRSHAETENVRRRGQEDVAKARKFAIESFAESLVPVCDSLEAALAQDNQTLESLTEGVNITLKQLDGAFERNGLKEVDPAVGDKFDPHLQQAIASVPADQPPNTIVTVLQKGYLIGDRVLRPALVTVAAG